MSRCLFGLCLVLTVIHASACVRPQGTTHADYGRISELRIKYKDRWIFKKKNTSLIVYPASEIRPDEQLIRRIFGEFFFDRHGHMRRNTAVRDLKLYDIHGEFLYRLHYVGWRGKVVKEDQR